MNLFPIWTGEITIPPLPTTREHLGRNFVVHRPTEAIVTEAQLFDADERGYRYFQTHLPPPFDILFLRNRGARRRMVGHGVLTLEDETPIDQISLVTSFSWDDPANVLAHFDNPAKIADSWKGRFRYNDENNGGLRPPQLGALHAIIAHFSVGRDFDPATVVLPTGTGKTETMLSALVCLRPKTLLVLVPSTALRTQIGAKFERLGLLRILGCIPNFMANPKVGYLQGSLETTEAVLELVDKCNIIVASADAIGASDPEVAKHLCDSFTQLYVDEAHHLGATTWQRIRDRFLKKQVVQFTATPFRRDKKHIGGKIIFNYKLGDAQRDGYYRQIRLDTVEEYGDEMDKDRAIATRAIHMLRQDRAEGLNHLVMARANNQSKVTELLELYRELAPEMNPVAIHSGLGKTSNDSAFAALRDFGPTGSRIVICVDMLGEGFDLPQLKIAAIHDNHKSLAVTLQFIGRFTRRAENVGDAGVVLNLADAEAEKRLEELYAEGADWDLLIRQLSEEKIDEELALQELIEGLKAGGDLHTKISLWNLQPSLTVQVFKTNCENWSPQEFQKAFSSNTELWHSLNPERNVLVVLARQEESVKWGGYEELQEISYGLLVAHWDSTNNALFVHSSDYEQMRSTQVARLITNEETQLFDGTKVFNVLNNVELPLAKSLGSSRIGAISFTSYFGPNVTEGLASIEKSESELNHIACLGYEDGDKVIWGASKKKAKIWQRSSGSINDWLRWCEKVYNKLIDDTGADTNITKDFLRPTKLTAAYEISAISIQWGEYLQSSFSDNLAIGFDGHEVPLHLVGIELVDHGDDQLRFKIFSEEHSSTYDFAIDTTPKGYTYTQVDGPRITFRIGRNAVREFDDQVYSDPPIVRYADGTYSYNNFHVPFDLGAGSYRAEFIEEWDWDGIDLTRESMGRNHEKDTIQFKTFEKLQDEFEVIFNDDGPAEAADLVCLKNISDTEIGLTLVHCKGAKDNRVSADIGNFYVLCGQAQKSITVKHEGIKKLSSDLRRRHEIWANAGSSRLLKGSLQRLSYFVEKARKSSVKFEIILVQPGFSRGTMSPDIAKLLATTELFLKRTTNADMRVIGSSPRDLMNL